MAKRTTINGRAPRNAGTCFIICALLAVAVLGVYGQTGRFDFTNYDDDTYVTRNPHIAGGLTAANTAWAFTSGYASNWHPLTWTSHMADITLFGLHPWGHHLVSVGLHAANTLLLFLVLSMMTGFVWRSAFVAALFALHPLHVESVAWIAERKDVLSTFFWLLTMLAHVYYVRRPRITRYLLIVLPFALGLVSKPMLVSLPIVLLLLDYWPLKRSEVAEAVSRFRLFRAFAIEKTPLFALAAGSCVVTYLVQKEGGAVGPIDRYPVGIRLANALVSYIGYAWKMIWPAKLAVFYPHPQDSLPVWQVAGAGLLLAALTYLSIRVGRRRPYVLVGWLWYVVTLIPVIGLVQVGSQSMADRYTYVPLIGLFIILAWGIGDLMLQRARLAAGLAVIVLLGLSVCSYRQVAPWRDGIALFRHAIAATPNSAVAYNNLATALAKAGRGQEACPYCIRALRINPTYADAHCNLAVYYAAQGDADAAEREYKLALKYSNRHAASLLNLGMLLGSQGRTREAVSYLEQAVRSQPDLAAAHYNLAVALQRLRRLDEAAEHYRTAAKLDPRNWRALHNLGVILARQGRLDEAISCYRKALGINPNHAMGKRHLATAIERKRGHEEE